MTHREQLESSKKKLILFVCCSFLPIIILIVQNSFFFKDMIDTRASVLAKAKLVSRNWFPRGRAASLYVYPSTR